ncbi:MAG: 30S ribosomal protein S20 [Verrucomicrobiota bacterium]
MANIRSAEKRVRQIKRRTLRNRAIKSRVKTFRKKVASAVEAGDKEEAAKALDLFASAVDKAAKANVFHKNAAARYKSSAARAVNTLTK